MMQVNRLHKRELTMLLYKNRSNASRLYFSNIKRKSDIQLRKRLTKGGNEYDDFTNLASVQIEATACSIPCSFGQNGNGSNKAFVIGGAEAYDRTDITIFSRCGKEVFRDRSYENDWEGQGLDEGVYYYVISMRNGRNVDVYRGWILLIRG